MSRIDVLMKQLEIAHKRDQQMGNFIMLVKGWALTLFLGTVVSYFEFVCPSQSSRYAYVSIPPFILLWIIEALMGAYQKPYYEKRDEIQKAIQKELREESESQDLVFVPYNEDANLNIEVLKDFLACFFHVTVGPFYLALIFMLFWLYQNGCPRCYLVVYISIVLLLAVIGGLSRRIEF